jgi:hypothetical protein
MGASKPDRNPETSTGGTVLGKLKNGNSCPVSDKSMLLQNIF